MFQSQLSLRLWSTLNKVGASERMRRMHQRVSCIGEGRAGPFEEGYTSKYGENCQNIVCGSYVEGSVTNGTFADFDNLTVINLPVIVSLSEVSYSESFLIVRDTHTAPGYVKLEIVKNGRPTTHLWHSSFQHDSHGRVCFKHCLWLFSTCNDPISGPAQKIFSNGRHVADHVHALRCKTIPAYACEWITRIRPNGWPSEKHIKSMSTMGCMFVGVGHEQSSEKDIEWRISFSQQEKLMMASLNSTQHKVYVLLKVIKKDVFDEMLTGSITSYHCKTCILHVVENTPRDLWTPKNLINCVLVCIRLLHKWVTRGNCPSFYIHEQNLFEKEKFFRNQKRLSNIIRHMLDTGCLFLYLIECDNIGEMLRSTMFRLYLLRRYAKRELTSRTYQMKKNWMLSVLTDSKQYMCLHPNVEVDTSYLRRILEKYDVSEVGKLDAHAVVRPWIYLHMAMQDICHAYREHIYMEKVKCLVDYNRHLKLGRKTDLVQQRLIEATIQYKFQNYSKCYDILQSVDNTLGENVVIFCVCSELCTEFMEEEMKIIIAKTPLRKLIASTTASCVVFRPSEIDIVPLPLRYEMQRSVGAPKLSLQEIVNTCWYGCCVVDVKIYLFLMLYLVGKALKREDIEMPAFRNLFQEVHVGSNFGHKETGYNVLGWIFMQEGRIGEAIRCFLLSEQERPFHNAAKFHFRDLLCAILPQIKYCHARLKQTI